MGNMIDERAEAHPLYATKDADIYGFLHTLIFKF
jgi:hypothetical protein